MALRINQRDDGPITILDLSGKVAAAAGESLSDRVESLIGAGRTQLILNLGAVSNIDSAGLSWFLSMRSAVVGAGGQLKLLNLTERVQDLIVTTKLEMVFDSYESEADAVKSFS